MVSPLRVPLGTCVPVAVPVGARVSVEDSVAPVREIELVGVIGVVGEVDAVRARADVTAWLLLAVSVGKDATVRLRVEDVLWECESVVVELAVSAGVIVAAGAAGTRVLV